MAIMLSRYKPSGGSKKATMDRIRSQRSAQTAAAYAIRRNPVLKGQVRSYSSYSGNYRYGGVTSELKFFDNTINVTTPAAGNVTQLLTIPQGVGQSERVGRRITVKAIVCNLTTYMNGTGVAAAIGMDRVRFVLVEDTQANGAACDWGTVSNGVFASASVDALRNLDNSARFRILKDWDLVLNCTAGVSGAWQYAAKSLNYYTKTNIKIEYDSSATTGAIGTIRSNNICLLAIGQTTTNGCNLSGTIRIRYSDA